MKIVLLFLVGMFSTLGLAQDGSLDVSFGNNGTVQTDIAGDTDMAISIAQQTDEKLLVAGQFKIQGQAFPSIARYNLNGTLDTSFGTNGVTVFNGAGYEEEYYRKVLSQSDGKIVASGSFSLTANSEFVVNRFLADGSVDTSFGNSGELIVFPESIYSGEMVLLNDDSLLAAGRLFENGISKIGLKKYLPDGTLDSTFGNNGVVITEVGNESNSAQKIEITSNNKIVVLGISQENGVTSQVLLRYLSNGTLDTSFGSNGIVSITNEPDYSSNHIALYNDGKIAVHSSFLDWQFDIMNNLIFRYLPDGSFDTSFGNNGYINPNRNNFIISNIEVQENQRLLVFGELTDFFEGGGPFFMKRYYIDGYVDTGFNFVTNSTEYFVTDMLIQQDGKITCLANTAWYNGQEDIIMERRVNNPLSTPEFENQKTTIYPNPSNGIFTIEREFPETTEYQITDITGKVIATGELTEKQTQLNLSSAQSGVYFLKTSNSVFRLMKN
ncbi:T9SS type A sorting domain-containing protein [Aequorivita flava]|jgi:uncharacterized delta-60 repeat protein|uniref:T9SS type A sorting domain-containing protein n=1 Tax=Aequorivita flava TaxID=3114371 RepID=A0AB35YMJ5_9FLAO